MKKTLLAICMAGASCGAFAQETGSTTDMTSSDTLSTYGTYSAYGVYAPDYIQSYVVRDYPTSSNVMWRQRGDWWEAYYLDQTGMPQHVYYNTPGNTFMVALPVKQTFVDDQVTHDAINLFGPSVYDITMMKGSMGQDVYQVRLLDNGVLRTEYMNPDGTKTIDVYRVETSPMNSVDMNVAPVTTTDESMDTNTSGKSKIKIKNDDGTETKIKTKNGQTKVKDN